MSDIVPTAPQTEGAATSPVQAVAVKQAAAEAKPVSLVGLLVQAGSSFVMVIAIYLVFRFHDQIDPTMDEKAMLALATAIAKALDVAVQWVTHRAVFKRLCAAAESHENQPEGNCP